MSKEKLTAYDNLLAQLSSIRRHNNQLSYETRARYYDSMRRFLHYYADEWHGQKIANVSAKHIYGYVEHLKSRNETSTIKADLAGIRHYHRLSGSKNILPDNSKLNIGKVEKGTQNRAWLPEEYKKAVALADSMGRPDVKYALRLSWNFGLRINEIATLRTEQIEKAIQYGDLRIKGKGGQIRFIPAETDNQKRLLLTLRKFARANGKHPGDYLLCDSKHRSALSLKRSLQNWIANHREKILSGNRTLSVKIGEKPRIEKISMHGLRHSYAQNTEKRLRAEGRRNVDKTVSENLGHHRLDITKIYKAQK